MVKSKLGISVGLLGALCFLLGLYGGYVIAGVVVGYILLKEENVWLKKLAVKVIALMLTFSLASTIINLIPNLLDILYSFLGLFGRPLYLSFIEGFFSILSQVLSLIRTILFLAMGALALAQKTIKIPGIDDLINKHMN